MMGGFPPAAEAAGGCQELKINNTIYHVNDIQPPMLLPDVLRDVLGLTGTHLGCEHAVCAACTVLMHDLPIRSCLMLAIQAHGHEITTVGAGAVGTGAEWGREGELASVRASRPRKKHSASSMLSSAASAL